MAIIRATSENTLTEDQLRTINTIAENNGLDPKDVMEAVMTGRVGGLGLYRAGDTDVLMNISNALYDVGLGVRPEDEVTSYLNRNDPTMELNPSDPYWSAQGNDVNNRAPVNKSADPGSVLNPWPYTNRPDEMLAPVNADFPDDKRAALITKMGDSTFLGKYLWENRDWTTEDRKMYIDIPHDSLNIELYWNKVEGGSAHGDLHGIAKNADGDIIYWLDFGALKEIPSGTGQDKRFVIEGVYGHQNKFEGGEYPLTISRGVSGTSSPHITGTLGTISGVQMPGLDDPIYWHEGDPAKQWELMRARSMGEDVYNPVRWGARMSGFDPVVGEYLLSGSTDRFPDWQQQQMERGIGGVAPGYDPSTRWQELSTVSRYGDPSDWHIDPGLDEAQRREQLGRYSQFQEYLQDPSHTRILASQYLGGRGGGYGGMARERGIENLYNLYAARAASMGQPEGGFIDYINRLISPGTGDIAIDPVGLDNQNIATGDDALLAALANQNIGPESGLTAEVFAGQTVPLELQRDQVGY